MRLTFAHPLIEDVLTGNDGLNRTGGFGWKRNSTPYPHQDAGNEVMTFLPAPCPDASVWIPIQCLTTAVCCRAPPALIRHGSACSSGRPAVPGVCRTSPTLPLSRFPLAASCNLCRAFLSPTSTSPGSLARVVSRG